MSNRKPENRFLEKELWWTSAYSVYFGVYAGCAVVENIFFTKSSLADALATGVYKGDPYYMK